MTLEEARRIVAEEDDSDTARSLQAVAVILRFHGIADKQLLPIAASLEEVAASLGDSEPDASGAPKRSEKQTAESTQTDPT